MEKERLEALSQYRIMDSPKESDYDDFTALAAQLTDSPIALISLLDDKRQWFKSSYGTDWKETPCHESFCYHAIQADDLLEVEDATLDPRFQKSFLVTLPPNVRFYAGAPLITPEGVRLGTLCVLDPRPKKLNEAQRNGMLRLSRQVMRLILSRNDQHSIEEGNRALRDQIFFTEQIIASSLDAVVVTDIAGFIKSWNPQAARIFGWTAEEAVGASIEKLLIAERSHSEHAEMLQGFVHRKREENDGRRFELFAIRKNGEEIPIELTITRIIHEGKEHFAKFIRDLSYVRNAEFQLRKTTELLGAVGKLQSSYITRASTNYGETFEDLLALILRFTDSEYGFIAEVLREEDGTPYMKTHAITDITWNEETRALFQKHKATGLEFRNLNSLFGRVLVTGEPMIANDPATHPHRGGLPPGHPPLNAFLGVPIWHGDELLAMAGVSNRPGGYDASLLKEIEPLMGTYAAIIRGFRFEKRLQEDKERIAALNHSLELRAAQLADALETNIRVERERVEALQEQSSLLEKRVIERTAELQSSQRQFEHLFEFAPDALFLTDDQGVIRLTNRAAEKMFGWSRDALFGKTLDELLTPSQRAIYQEVKSRPHSSGENTSIWGRKQDGSEFPLDLRISRLNIMGEQCLVTAMRDVSERNHLEHELSRISSHEQERISHELHDHLGAYLAGIAFRFKSLAERVKSTSTAEVDTIDELVGQVNSAIRQVRDFVRLLSPVDLESGGLPRGLEELGREMESVFDIKCHVQAINDLPPLTLEQSMHLYRIAQEATRNAIQHGRAKTVSILLTKNAGDLQLVISNDGEGWNPEMQQARGMGLRIMRHRALSIGGTINMDANGKGNLVVSCLLPLPTTTS